MGHGALGQMLTYGMGEVDIKKDSLRETGSAEVDDGHADPGQLLMRACFNERAIRAVSGVSTA